MRQERLFLTARRATALFVAALWVGSALAHGDVHKQDAAPGQMHATAEQRAFGIAGDPKRATRTIEIDMRDTMRFVPAQIDVKRGETVRFVVRNSGAVLHELVLGGMTDLEHHAALMKKFPGMEHDAPYMVHVDPGKQGEFVWQFNRAGEFNYGCLIPGHFEAGMIGRIRVK